MNTTVLAAPRAHRISQVITAVALTWELSPLVLLSKDRHKSIAEARNAVYWLARRATRLSYPEIGFAMGKRDHTTIMAGEQTIERRILTDEWLRDTLNALLAELLGDEEEVTIQ